MPFFFYKYYNLISFINFSISSTEENLKLESTLNIAFIFALNVEILIFVNFIDLKLSNNAVKTSLVLIFSAFKYFLSKNSLE